MVAAVVRFLTNVAGPTGILLVLDDLQWAGRDALDLLTTLLRSADELPVRVLGAYRDTGLQAGDTLSAFLADLAGAALARQRILPPLTGEAAGHLLDRLLEGHETAAASGAALDLAQAGQVATAWSTRAVLCGEDTTQPVVNTATQYR
jgi:predicted ATPase